MPALFNLLLMLLRWVARLGIFVAFFFLALKNRHLVDVYWGATEPFQLTMAWLVIAVLIVGILIGLAITLPRMLRYRMQRNTLQATYAGEQLQGDHVEQTGTPSKR